MELKTRVKLNGRTYGLRPRAENETGVDCAALCPISEKCKGVRSDRAFCALMKIMDGINLCDFRKYIIYEIIENK